MKQPITGRDLFVISTLCTGFGVLLAWGLFYRWGSAPAAKTVDLAAWFQAIMSVVAILAAAFIPRWHDAQKRYDAADQFLVLAKYMLERAASLGDSVSTEGGRRGMAMFGHSAEWRSIADGANELSLDILPSGAYLPAWLQLREMAVRMSEFNEAVIKYGDDRNSDWYDERYTLDGYITRTRSLYNELVTIDIVHRGDRGYVTAPDPD